MVAPLRGRRAAVDREGYLEALQGAGRILHLDLGGVM